MSENVINELRHITRGNTPWNEKSKVYFASCEQDKKTYFSTICDLIFDQQDCAIFYTDDMEADYSEELLQTDMQKMQLFVFPITQKLLESNCRAVTTDLNFALDNNKPILPLMMEEGIDELFERKFGKLQYLRPNNNDNTSIRFEDKLRDYLQNVLIGPEERKRIQAAFDAYIFLSYRKKDRDYANRLMRLIHQNPICRAVAIWYDEYLVPGERFDESIEKAMDKSNLFALLVTPSLLQKNDKNADTENYVIAEEYPRAHKRSVEWIIPIEMKPLSLEEKEELKEKCEDLPDCIKGEDTEEFRLQFSEKLKNIALTENSDNPVHNFLIGLAYLAGIDMEVNYEYALKLIGGAAEAELPEAMEKLAGMYHDGIGVKRNLYECLKWMKKDADFIKKQDGANAETIVSKETALASCYKELEMYNEAISVYLDVLEMQKKLSGEDKECTFITLKSLADCYYESGNMKEALTTYEKLHALQQEKWGENNEDVLFSLEKIADCHYSLLDEKNAAIVYAKAHNGYKESMGEFNSNALRVFQKILKLDADYEEVMDEQEIGSIVSGMKNVLGLNRPVTPVILSMEQVAINFSEKRSASCDNDGDTDRIRYAIAMYYLNSGRSYYYSYALQQFNKLYDARRERYGEKHPLTLEIMDKIAFCLYKDKNYEEAYQKYDELIKLQEEVFGVSHPKALTSLLYRTDCAFCLYEESGEFTKNDILKIYREVFLKRKELYGNNHSSTLLAYEKTLCFEKKSYQAGQYLKLLKKCVKMYGLNNRYTLSVWEKYAELCLDTNFDRAMEEYGRLYVFQKEKFGENSRRALTSFERIADICFKRKNYQKAYGCYEKLYKYYLPKKQTQGAYSDTIDRLVSKMEVCYTEEQNEQYLQEAGSKTIRKKIRLADTFYESENSYEKALPLYTDVLSILVTDSEHLTGKKAILGETAEEQRAKSSFIYQIKIRIAVCNFKTSSYKHDRLEQSMEEFESIYAEMTETLGMDNPETLRPLETIAELLYAEENRYRYKECTICLFERIYELRKQIYGLDDPRTYSVLERCEGCLAIASHKDDLDHLIKLYSNLKTHFGENNDRVMGILKKTVYCFDSAYYLKFRIPDRDVSEEQLSVLESREGILSWTYIDLLLRKQMELLGSDHEEVTETISVMSDWLFVYGETDQAMEMKVVIDERLDKQGKYPDSSRQDEWEKIAVFYSEKGDVDRAVEFYKKILEYGTDSKFRIMEKIADVLGESTNFYRKWFIPDIYSKLALMSLDSTVENKSSFYLEKMRTFYENQMEDFSYSEDLINGLKLTACLYRKNAERYSEIAKELDEKSKKVSREKSGFWTKKCVWKYKTTDSGSEPDLDESLKEFQFTWDREKERHGEEHPYTIEVKAYIADCLFLQGKKDDAMEIYREIAAKTYRKPDPDRRNEEKRFHRLEMGPLSGAARYYL